MKTYHKIFYYNTEYNPCVEFIEGDHATDSLKNAKEKLTTFQYLNIYQTQKVEGYVGELLADIFDMKQQYDILDAKAAKQCLSHWTRIEIKGKNHKITKLDFGENGMLGVTYKVSGSAKTNLILFDWEAQATGNIGSCWFSSYTPSMSYNEVKLIQ